MNIKKILYALLGSGFLLIALVVYLATWFIVFPLILGDGSYPVILAAIPALPFVWPAWVFLKKAGMTEGSLQQVRTWRVYLWAYVAFVFLFAAVILIMVALGVLD